MNFINSPESRASFWLLADQVFRAILGLTFGLLLARHLGPDQFGLWSWATALTTIFAIIQRLGTDQIILREFSHSTHQVPTQNIAGSALATLLLAAVICFFGIFFFAFFSISTNYQIMPIILPLALANYFLLSEVFEAWFQSRFQAEKYILLKAPILFSFFLLKTVVLMTSGSLRELALVLLFESLVSSCAVAYLFHRQAFSLSTLQVSVSEMRRLFRSSWPYLISSALVMIYMRIDQIMLGEMVGNHSVGIYSVAVRVSEVFSLITSAIIAAAIPNLVRLSRTSESEFLLKQQILYNKVTFLGYVVAVSLTIFARPLIRFIFGAEYEEAWPSLIVLAWCIPFINLGMARTAYFTAMDWTKSHTLTVLLGAIVNIVLNIFMIPSMKEFGAALASLISYSLAGYFSCFLIPHLRATARMQTKALFWPKFW